MLKSNKVLSTIKKRFLLYSLSGVVLVFCVSYFSLSTYRNIVAKQTAIQKMYSSVSRQMFVMNKLTLFLNQTSNETKNPQLIKDVEELLLTLKIESNGFYQWYEQYKLEGLYVHLKYKDLIHKFSVGIKSSFLNEGRRNIDQRSDIFNLKRELLETLRSINLKLKDEQKRLINNLNQGALILVLSSVFQVIFVWIVVFRPLYSAITEQHQKLVDSMMEAKSADRSKTEFLANISHEIRTPMMGIMGYAEVLQKKDSSEEEKNEAIKTIDKNGNHLLSLIDEILDISKIEAGKMDFNKEKTDLAVLLNEVYSLINVKAKEKGIDLFFRNVNPFPDKILIDPKRLKQILFNIIGNAIKFTSKGKVEVFVSYDKDEKLLSLKVVDTGAGIAEKDLKKLFKPFQQADSSGARKFGGTGLGLVLSRSLAQAMGGDVRILKSKLDVGTEVEIILDVDDSEDFSLTNELTTHLSKDFEQSVKADFEGLTILVVDDAKENARLFSIFLSETGASIDLAYDGIEALEKVNQNEYDLILLDLQMPGKDGYEVMETLNQQGFDRPVVALTAHALKEERDKTKKAGFSGHISKPVKQAKLINSICQVLNA